VSPTRLADLRGLIQDLDRRESTRRSTLLFREEDLAALRTLSAGEQPTHGFMAPDWAIEPTEAEIAEDWPPMKLTQAGRAWLAERDARLTNSAERRLDALEVRLCHLFTAPTRAENGVDRLIAERDELRLALAAEQLKPEGDTTADGESR
jgi:hypothetical protein